MDEHGYEVSEVAERFGVHPETVRLAGIRGDLAATNLNAGGTRARWRYPASEIEALDGWPAGRRGPRVGDDGARSRQAEFNALRAELEQERVGRGVAEQRVVELELEVDKLRAALLVFVDPDRAAVRRR